MGEKVRLKVERCHTFFSNLFFCNLFKEWTGIKAKENQKEEK